MVARSERCPQYDNDSPRFGESWTWRRRFAGRWDCARRLWVQVGRKINSQTPPPRSRPIVFVSHSARGDPDSHASLKAIEAQLKKAGFDVLLDETRLKGGEPWRNCLHTWMGHCHGAILLLTPKALQSPWVLKEATILSWRNSLSAPGEFLLVPVLLGISPNELAANTVFAPLNLQEVQAIKGLKGAALAKALVALFEPL